MWYLSASASVQEKAGIQFKVRQVGIIGAAKLGAVLLIASMLLLPATLAQSDTLRVAMYANPPTLDIMATTSILTHDTMRHVYEGLFTFNSEFEPVPFLVDEFTVSDDGTVYTFEIRQGVLFHSGEELTADDVIASLERSFEITTLGPRFAGNTVSLEPAGDYTVVWTLEQPDTALTVFLALPYGAFIYPKQVVELYPDRPIDDLSLIIGTGPFQLDEFRPDVHVRLVRFDDYVGRSEPADGRAGRREALVDALEILVVPERSVRQAGVQTGQFHIAYEGNPDDFERLSQSTEFRAEVIKPNLSASLIWTYENEFAKNQLLRQAVVAALDMETIMALAVGPRELWRLNHGLVFPEQPMWTDVGSEFYNQNDPELARALLDEAQYDGTPFKLLASPDRDIAYNIALIVRDQLENVGINVELRSVDWPTMVAIRGDPEQVTAATGGIGFASVQDPTLMLFLQPRHHGMPNEGAPFHDVLDQMRAETDPERWQALFEEVQRTVWEEARFVWFGDHHSFHLVRNEVEGYVPGPDMYLWNVSLRD